MIHAGSQLNSFNGDHSSPFKPRKMRTGIVFTEENGIQYPWVVLLIPRDGDQSKVGKIVSRG